MRRILGAGGLGDAAMIYAKIYADYISKGDYDFEVTHAEVPSELLSTIAEFYKLQGIQACVEHVLNWDWLESHRGDYDVFYETDNVGMDPFPDVQRPHLFQGTDVVVVPAAGRVSERKLIWGEVLKFKARNLDKRIYVLEKQENLAAVMAILGSADVVISPIGFCVFISCMMRKKVYVTSGFADALERRRHPDWDLTVVDYVGEIAL